MPPFNIISRRSTPENVLSSKRNQKLQESEDERRARLDDYNTGNELARFLMRTIFLVIKQIIECAKL